MDITPDVIFAELLRAYRAAHGFTQEELAERAGLSPRGIVYLERGERRPNGDTVRRLAEALALSEDEQTAFVMASRRSRADPAARPTFARADIAALAPDPGRQTDDPPLYPVPDNIAQPWVFLAHAHADLQIAERLTADLRNRGVASWVNERDLQPGTVSWEQALREVIRAAGAVLLIATPHTRASRYIPDELRIAELYERRIYPIWLEGDQWLDCVPLGWGGLQYLDARADTYAKALDGLADMLSGVHPHRGAGAAASTDREAPTPRIPATLNTVSAAGATPRNPYKGLRAFVGEDTGDFFGREALITDLQARLADADAATPRFLALLGASGSGKSSVLLAGLVPRLRGGALPGSEGWIYLAPIVPGAHPLETLAVTLGQAMPGSSLSAIRADLDHSPRGLHLLGRRLAAHSEQRVVMVVDQSEEIFTLVDDEAERRAFIDLLATAVVEPGGAILVLLTLRADFYDRPLRYPALGALLQSHGIAVLPMNTAELRRAIEGPAALPDVAVHFEADLVGDLLFEVRDQAGALPLLQFTLDQLFERREGCLLTGSAYRGLGGVRGALARHAEATFAELAGDDQRRMARALFLRLIDPGDTEQDTTRRRASRTELTLPDPEATARLQQVADRFITARLLVTATQPPPVEGGVSVVTLEVSHEALIREWARLGDWLREAREDIRRQQMITADAAQWEQRGRPEDNLYRGSVLLDAEAWAARNTPSAAEIAFLIAAREAHGRQESAEGLRQARQLTLTQEALTANRRAANRLRLLAGVMATFLVVAVALTFVALYNAAQARTAERTAQSSEAQAIRSQHVALTNARNAAVARSALSDRDLALSTTLAAEASGLLKDNYDLALLLSVSAERAADTVEARTNLLDALEDQPDLNGILSGPSGPVGALAFSPNGRILAAGSNDHTIRLWDTATQQPLGPALVDPASPIESLAFGANGSLLASGSADGTIRLWRKGKTQTWTPLGEPLRNGQDQVSSLAFSRDGTVLVAAGWDGIRLWHLTNGRPRSTVLTTLGSDTGAMALGLDGTTLATTGLDDTSIQLWNLTTGQPSGSPLPGDGAVVEHLAFSPDGALLASGSDNGTVSLWNPHSRRHVGAPISVGGNSQCNPAFSADGKILAVASGDQTMLWKVADHSRFAQPLTIHTGAVDSLAFNPVTDVLATGSAGHTIQLWRLPSGDLYGDSLLRTQVGSQSGVESVALSPVGTQVASGGADGRIQLWNMADHQPAGLPFVAGRDEVNSLLFNPAGTILASGDEDGTLRLWDVPRRRPLGVPLTKGGVDAMYDPLAFSPDGAILAAGEDNGTVRLWDVAHHKVLATLSAVEEADPIAGLAFSPNGKSLAATSTSGLVLLWDITTRRLRWQAQESVTGLFSLVFSPDGTLIASGGGDGIIQLWDAVLGRPAGSPLTGDPSELNSSLAFSPDGAMLASAGLDGPLRLWSVIYRKPIGEPLYDGGIVGLAFNRAGTSLITGNLDGSISQWDISVTSWIQRACRIADRNMTVQEWQTYLGSAPYQNTCPANR